MRIATVGSGISGLVSAFLLSEDHDVTVFEKNDYVGGHTHTIDVEMDDGTHPVDTGFIVFNPENYPNLTRLLELLAVETQPSTMSFSVRDEESGLEYNGHSLNTLFAQRKNLLRPRFLRMVRDILRFYREARELLEADDDTLTLAQYLDRRGYSEEFKQWHIYPMGAAIWSTGSLGIAGFPAVFFVEFFDNHGFLNLGERPKWRVLKGGSKSYVQPLTAPFKDRIRLGQPVVGVRRKSGGVEVRPLGRDWESFDRVILATHSDQALAILQDPTPQEREILGSIPYSNNDTVLHTDEALLPSRRLARASWNYHLPMRPDNRSSVTYYMNSLQGIRSTNHFCVTLNRTERIDSARIIERMEYEHPVYTTESLKAQQRKAEINGRDGVYFCGAYWGYGFHEDGVNSALEVCTHFGKRLPK